MSSSSHKESGKSDKPKAAGNRGRGRPKGALSRTKQSILEELRQAHPGYNPLVEIKRLIDHGKLTDKEKGQFHAEIAQYCIPKLKAVELTNPDGTAVASSVTLNIISHEATKK